MDQATATMIANYEKNTGKPFEAWIDIARKAKLAKHGEIVKLLKEKHGMGHGYANLVAMTALQGDSPAPAGEDLVAENRGEAGEGLEGLQSVPDGTRSRTAPAPLRSERRVPRDSCRKRNGDERNLSRQPARGDHRTARPSLVCRRAVPSRIEIARHERPSALPGVCPRGSGVPSGPHSGRMTGGTRTHITHQRRRTPA